MPLSRKLTFSVPRTLADKRSDVALTELLNKKVPREEPFTRGFVSRLFKSGAVFRNGVLATPKEIVKNSDVFEVPEASLVRSDRTLKRNPELSVKVIFEDDQVLFIDKPAGMQVHPAGRHQEDTLANWLVTHVSALQDMEGDASRPGIVHRLDRETSGIMVVAKTKESLAALKELFQMRQVEKTYVALVSGHLSEQEGIIDAPLVRRKASLKRSIATKRQREAGESRPAATAYQVIARASSFDVLRAVPKTGRTHQIRVHLASLGHPVLGDKLYAFKDARRDTAHFPKRHMLHAHRLKFELFGRKYDFSTPLPEDFRNLLKSVDETRDTGYDGEALKSLL